jgi:hypothetical protein
MVTYGGLGDLESLEVTYGGLGDLESLEIIFKVTWGGIRES